MNWVARDCADIADGENLTTNFQYDKRDNRTVVIAVVASFVLGPLASAIAQSLFAGATTTIATVASYAIAGAVIGAAASIVQQGLFIALGYQDSFSWKDVAAGAKNVSFGSTVELEKAIRSYLDRA